MSPSSCRNTGKCRSDETSRLRDLLNTQEGDTAGQKGQLTQWGGGGAENQTTVPTEFLLGTVHSDKWSCPLSRMKPRGFERLHGASTFR